jgi:hypothetical protein
MENKLFERVSELLKNEMAKIFNGKVKNEN